MGTEVRLLRAIIVVCIFWACATPASTAGEAVTLIRLEFSSRGLEYSVNGELCTTRGANNDLFGKLVAQYRNSGRGQLVVILFQKNVPLDRALEVKMVAQKVGFERISMLLDDPEARAASELVFGPWFVVKHRGNRYELEEKP
jgi:hypothetical protein